MMRSQSLSHIPRELGSLPSLHHASSLHVLHENYVSTPDVSATLGSPPPYCQVSFNNEAVLCLFKLMSNELLDCITVLSLYPTVVCVCVCGIHSY